MSADDAATNTQRAERIQSFVDGARVAGAKEGITIYVGTHQGQDVTAELSLDDLAAAANALHAQGVKGWAAARLYAQDAYRDEAIGDTILEAADCYDSVLETYRKEKGDAIVDAAIEELEEQL